jgi:Tfp pilus assembly protein PilV
MRRTGTTLIEVLMAIFIMALGLVALLTLFPLGALNMARAVQDERAAQAAANATSLFRMNWKQMCEQAAMGSNSQTTMYSQDACQNWFSGALDNANAGLVTGSPVIRNHPFFAATMSGVNRNTPSVPVLVDPVGWCARSSDSTNGYAGMYWVADDPLNRPAYTIPRRSMPDNPIRVDNTNMAPGMAAGRYKTFNSTDRDRVERLFYLSDDTGFMTDDHPPTNIKAGEYFGGRPDQRQRQYSYAYLVKRNQNNDRQAVDLTVVVYFKRSMESPSPERWYNDDGSAAAGGSQLVIPFTAEKPAIGRGSWILDATMESMGTWVNTQGYFYRVMDVAEGATQVVLTLDRPLRRLANPNTATPRMIIVPDGVLEVFEKGTIDPLSPSRVN